jgi:nitrogen-specific signal transduction histidine kinase
MVVAGYGLKKFVDRGASLFGRVTRWNEKYALPVLVSTLAILTLVYYLGELLDTLGFSAFGFSISTAVHDAHRLLFIIPIVFAAYHFGIRGAIFTTLAATVVFIPRAVFFSPYPDPFIRIVLFSLISGLAGFIVAAMRRRHENQERLKTVATAERNRFMNILDSVGDGVCIIGPDHRLRFINPVLRTQFGEGAGSYCHEYFFRSAAPCQQDCSLEVVLSGECKSREYVFPGNKTFEILASPFTDSDGVTCQMTTLRDVTRHKRTELELVGLSNFKSDVLSNLSHELKSPLTSIKGAVSSLFQKDVEFDADTREQLLSGVLEETHRLEKLVTNLLDMSKLEAGVWKPVKKRCNVFDLVNESVARFSWGHREHVFEVQIEADLPDLEADYYQIRQVLNNLLDNAAAYSDKGTKIITAASRVEESIEFSVADEGAGIPPGETHRLFTKFYRGKQMRQHSGGVGLGLAICQAIVISHGGRIWADSHLGAGSIFYFTLPI